MWRNNKEWIYLIGSILLLFPGGYYFLSETGYHEYVISDAGSSRIIQLIPEKKHNHEVVIKIEGDLNVNYGLKLDYYYKKRKAFTDSSDYYRSASETISMPAGKIHAIFTRGFYADPENGKITITYLPEKESGNGNVKIQAGIF